MDEETIFRRLVGNQFCPDLDYMECKFSFRTVFYKNIYSYCCCPCGIEHEYLEYINDGNVNEAVFVNVLQNISAGKCPHVDEVDKKYVTETSVNAIHIAAAVGSTRAVRTLVNNYRIKRGSLFRLTPFLVAVLKGQYGVVDLLLEGFNQMCYDIDTKLMTAKWLPDDRSLRIEWMSVLGYTIYTRNLQMLKLILSPRLLHNDLYTAFEMTFKEDLPETENSLLKYLRRLDTEEKGIWIMCFLCAIVYDKPKSLQNMLDVLFSIPRKNSLYIVSIFSIGNPAEISAALKRHDCSVVLSKLGFKGSNNEVHIAGNLFLLYQIFINYKDEILAALKLNPRAINIMNNPYMDKFLCDHQSRSQYGLCKLMNLLEIGVEVDVEYWLIQLLSNKQRYSPFGRQALELLIKENPAVDTCPNAVRMAFELDEYLEERKIILDLSGLYIANGVEHKLFDSTSVNKAYNFVGPILIENGFLITRDILEEALEMNLHPFEKDYLLHYLQHPRSLKLSCCHVLRRHYMGRLVHQFLKVANIPNSMKDFIQSPSPNPCKHMTLL